MSRLSVISLAKFAGADDLIDKLPDKYQTVLDEFVEYFWRDGVNDWL